MEYGRESAGEKAKNQAVYNGLRSLLDTHLAVLPAEVMNRTSAVTFAFYTPEAPVNVVRVDHPQRETMEVTFIGHVPSRSALFALDAEGNMYLEGAFGDGAAASSAYASFDEPLGAELGSDFVNNFDFYYPLLEQSRVTAIVELSPPLQE